MIIKRFWFVSLILQQFQGKLCSHSECQSNYYLTQYPAWLSQLSEEEKHIDITINHTTQPAMQSTQW